MSPSSSPVRRRRPRRTNEDHIVELRAQIDRQYFDQKQVEQQLTALLQRQETLE